MEALATDLCLHWLCAPAAEPLTIVAEQRELPRTAVPVPEGQGWIELLELPLGMHICRVVHRFAPGMTGLAPMSAVNAELEEPLLFIQTTRQGSGVLHDRRLGQRLSHDAATGLFAHLDRVEHEHWADTRATIEVTALGIGASRLQSLLGAAAALRLLDALGIAALPSARAHPLPPPLKALLESALASHLTGHLRQLQAQSRVLDFLVALLGHAQQHNRPSARQRRMLADLREELDQWPGHIPDLDALASRYGRSVRALNEGFKQAFGQTLSAYLTERRLAAAYVCLQTTDLPIKTVATRLGYASVSHFSQAFTRQFGIRPGRLRKALLAESED